MNLHFFHEKMKLKKNLFIFFFVYSSQFHICLRSFSLQVKSKNIILYRIHTFKYMYVDRQLQHHLKISKCLLYILVMKFAMKIEQIRFYYGYKEASLSRIYNLQFIVLIVLCRQLMPSSERYYAQQSINNSIKIVFGMVYL